MKNVNDFVDNYNLVEIDTNFSTSIKCALIINDIRLKLQQNKGTSISLDTAIKFIIESSLDDIDVNKILKEYIKNNKNEKKNG